MTAPLALALAGLIVVLLLARAVSGRPHPDIAPDPDAWRCPNCGGTEYAVVLHDLALECTRCRYRDFDALDDDEPFLEL